MDISRSGIGLVSFVELAVDAEVILVLKERGITLKVKWCKLDSVRKGVFHVGLETHNISINLLSLLEAEGLTPPVVANTTQPKIDIKASEFAEYRTLLVTARTQENNILRQGKLAPLGDAYNAYPVNSRGKSRYVLIPKGMKPIEVSKFSDSEAESKKIFVIAVEQGQLTVIFPRHGLPPEIR